MTKLSERLHVGDIEDCVEGGDGWAIVHACRQPCFRTASTRLIASESTPWSLLAGDNLYLDLIDPPQPLFEVAVFTAFLDFAERHDQRGDRLLIHCNRGRSRAPSLALLFLAKRRRSLPDTSFDEASRAFEALMPSYAPGAGIRAFLQDRWSEL